MTRKKVKNCQKLKEKSKQRKTFLNDIFAMKLFGIRMINPIKSLVTLPQTLIWGTIRMTKNGYLNLHVAALPSFFSIFGRVKMYNRLVSTSHSKVLFTSFLQTGTYSDYNSFDKILRVLFSSHQQNH